MALSKELRTSQKWVECPWVRMYRITMAWLKENEPYQASSAPWVPPTARIIKRSRRLSFTEEVERSRH